MDNKSKSSILAGVPTWTLPNLPWGSRRQAKRMDRICHSKKPSVESQSLTPAALLSASGKSNPADVTRVDLSGQSFSGSAPPDDFGDFVRLHTVLADFNRLHLGAFSGLSALRDLSLVSNHIRELPKYIRPESGFLRLEMLDLSENPRLPQSMIAVSLGHLPKLRQLFLRSCHISRLPRELGMQTVRLLDLRENLLADGPATMLTLSRLPNLQKLMLDGNHVRKLPLLLTRQDASNLEQYWHCRDLAGNRADDLADCWCHTTHPPRVDGVRCRCGVCVTPRPQAECGCRQGLPAELGATCCALPDRVREWSLTPAAARVIATVTELARLQGGDSALERSRNRPGDAASGTPGRLFGAAFFVVPHEPFRALRELSLRSNLLERLSDVLGCTTWRHLRRLSLFGCLVVDQEDQLPRLEALLGHGVIDLTPYEGESESMKSLHKLLDEEERKLLDELETEMMCREFLEEAQIRAEVLSESRREEQEEEEVAEEEPAGPREVEFGAWWSSSSSSSEGHVPPPPPELVPHLRRCDHLRKHWDTYWSTSRPPPPPPQPTPVCRPGERCLRVVRREAAREAEQDRIRKQQAEELRKKLTEPCRAGELCPSSLRKALWKVAWGPHDKKPTPKVEDKLPAEQLGVDRLMSFALNKAMATVDRAEHWKQQQGLERYWRRDAAVSSLWCKKQLRRSPTS